MRALTTKELVSLAVIALTAPLLAFGIIIAARIMVVAGNELLLLALTLQTLTIALLIMGKQQ